jgi:hypothetical protein
VVPRCSQFVLAWLLVGASASAQKTAQAVALRLFRPPDARCDGRPLPPEPRRPIHSIPHLALLCLRQTEAEHVDRYTKMFRDAVKELTTWQPHAVP